MYRLLLVSPPEPEKWRNGTSAFSRIWSATRPNVCSSTPERPVMSFSLSNFDARTISLSLRAAATLKAGDKPTSRIAHFRSFLPRFVWPL